MPSAASSRRDLDDLLRRFAALEARRATLLGRLRAASDEQRGFRPEPHAWSMVDVAHHLLLVESGALGQVGRYLSAPRPAGLRSRIAYAALWLFFRAGIRIKAPVRSVVPQGDIALDELERRWTEIRATLRAELERLPPGMRRTAVVRHPIVGLLDAAQALGFIRLHFDHHLKQIERLRRAPAFPR